MKEVVEGTPARIQRVNPDLRDRFSKLLAEEHRAQLEAFLASDATLDQALQQVQREDDEAGVREELADLVAQRANLGALLDRLLTLPLPTVVRRGRAAEFIEILDEIQAAARQQISFLGGASEESSGAATAG
jgi:hypothetical protein